MDESADVTTKMARFRCAITSSDTVAAYVQLVQDGIVIRGILETSTSRYYENQVNWAFNRKANK